MVGIDPSRAYLVCGSQRSGSTLVVEMLRATGILGAPEEHFHFLRHSSLSPRPREWFADVADPAVLDLLPPLETGKPDLRTAGEWVDHIRPVGLSSNGVWGGKLMWNQVPVLLDRIDGWAHRSGSGLRSALRDLLGGDPVYVHVWREDVVPQAVSMWRAVQTEIWRGSTPPELDARAEYHADGIAHLADILLTQRKGWREWFAAEGITPIDIAFSALAEDPRRQVSPVVEALGFDPTVLGDSPLQRQGDSRSAEWVQRYREDAAARSLPQ